MDRVVRAQSLTAMLADDAISDATFKERVTFEDQGLSARAAEISYQPKQNKIVLRGSDAGGPPHVSVDQISIDARTIDVGLEGRQITATEVKTTLAPQKNAQARGLVDERHRDSWTAETGPGRQHQRECARLPRTGRSGGLSRRRDAVAGEHDDTRETRSVSISRRVICGDRFGEIHARTRHRPVHGQRQRDSL